MLKFFLGVQRELRLPQPHRHCYSPDCTHTQRDTVHTHTDTRSSNPARLICTSAAGHFRLNPGALALCPAHWSRRRSSLVPLEEECTGTGTPNNIWIGASSCICGMFHIFWGYFWQQSSQWQSLQKKTKKRVGLWQCYKLHGRLLSHFRTSHINITTNVLFLKEKIFAELHWKYVQFNAALLIGRRFAPGWTCFTPFWIHLSLNDNSGYNLSSKLHLNTVIIQLYNMLTLLLYSNDWCVFLGMR